MPTFECGVLVEHAVSFAGECGWRVDFLANFSLMAKRKKKGCKKEKKSPFLTANISAADSC